MIRSGGFRAVSTIVIYELASEQVDRPGRLVYRTIKTAWNRALKPAAG